jgi:hypothetical protein
MFWKIEKEIFGSLPIDSGVYYYNGKSFQHFTTREGLANNQVCLFMKIKPVIFGSAPEVERKPLRWEIFSKFYNERRASQ